jgi:hypothetical protein
MTKKGITRGIYKRTPDGPTPVDQLANASKAAARVVSAFVSNKPILVSDEVQAARLAVCRGCSYWRESGNLGFGKCTHGKCGCTRLKHRLATENCPLGKWPDSPTESGPFLPK